MYPLSPFGVPAHPRLQEPARAEAPQRPRRLEPPAIVTIGQIQGDGLRSPLEGQRVTTTGVVTETRGSGFYMQAEIGEAAPGSRGIWVYTGADHTGVAIGDKVTVTGDVEEFKFRMTDKKTGQEIVSNDQPITELGGRLTMMIVARGLDLDKTVGSPRLVGKSGLKPPTSSAVEGIKFYEGMEGERVTIKDLVVVGPTSFGKFVVVTDGGAVATSMTPIGTLIQVGDDDAQPEALTIKMVGATPAEELALVAPKLKVGDRIPGEVTGILSYDRGMYVLEVTKLPPIVEAPAPSFKPTLKKSDTEMLGCGINCENLSAKSPIAKFERIARKIIDYDGDVLALQEIQDDDGPLDSGVTSGKLTLKTLCDTIVRLGGPQYDFHELEPKNNQDGGEPGGNIRCAFLVDPKRFKVDTALTRRLGEDSPFFTSTRKSLELHGTFLPTGKKAVWINDHWSSKGGSDSAFGERQPPRDPTAPKRVGQQNVIHNRMVELGKDFPDAAIIAIGDENQTPGESVRSTQVTVRSKIQHVSAALPPQGPRSYIYNGNAQTINQVQVHIGTKVKVEIDDTNPRLPFGHPDRDSDHGHTIVLVDMRIPKSRKKLRAA